MEKQDLRIIYMGTPDFAVESLKRLVEGGYNVVAVITMPDKPAGRGHKIQYSPVKEYALSRGLPILQPEKLKDECFIEQLRELHVWVLSIYMLRFYLNTEEPLLSTGLLSTATQKQESRHSSSNTKSIRAKSYSNEESLYFPKIM